MGVSQVYYGEQELIDLADDTVTPETLLEGMTAHNSSGSRIVGILPSSGNSGIPVKLLRNTVGWTGKNEWINKAVGSYTVNGIDWIVNDNGTISADGTASSNSWITSDIYELTDHSARLLSGVPEGGGSSTFELHCRIEKTVEDFSGSGLDSWYITCYNMDGTDGYHQNTVIPNDYHYIRYEVGIRSGQTVEDIVFCPMFCDSSIIDSTFEPNHKTAEELLGVWTPEVSCAVGDTTCTVNHSDIHTTSIIANVFTQTSSGDVIAYTNVAVTEGQAVITWASALTEAASVRLNIINL